MYTRWASAPPSAWRSWAAMMLAGSLLAAIAEARAWRSRWGWAATPALAARRAKARLAWLGLTGVPRSVRNTRSSSTGRGAWPGSTQCSQRVGAWPRARRSRCCWRRCWRSWKSSRAATGCGSSTAVTPASCSSSSSPIPGLDGRPGRRCRSGRSAAIAASCPAPVQLDQLLLGLAERADVLVDFTGLPVGTDLYLINEGPDEPFGGGEPEEAFEAADPATTGQVLKLTVVPLASRDTSVPPDHLRLPTFKPLGPATRRRRVSLNEEDSAVLEGVGPRAALLGTLSDGNPVDLGWDDDITENPALNAIE